MIEPQIRNLSNLNMERALKSLQHPGTAPYLGKHTEGGPIHQDWGIPFFLSSGMPEHFEVQQLAGSRNDAFSSKEGAGEVL